MTERIRLRFERTADRRYTVVSWRGVEGELMFDTFERWWYFLPEPDDAAAWCDVGRTLREAQDFLRCEIKPVRPEVPA